MYQLKLLTVLFIFISVIFNPLYSKDIPKPSLMLANIYHQDIDLRDFWVSEKYDGVRAFWDGEKFLSRAGNIYQAPTWFTENFPKHKLDGELWIGRQSFELLLSTVRDKVPDDKAWGKVKYMVFDMPELSAPFDLRLQRLNTLIQRANISWLQAVKQWKVKDHSELLRNLELITTAGAEGLMLHRGSSLYKGKRNGDLFKLKLYEDAEAIVIDHLPGKGKYSQMMGAMIVEIKDGLRFKLGTGFSDKERRNPPAIGEVVTFKFYGKSKNGVPRFASYLRARKR